MPQLQTHSGLDIMFFFVEGEAEGGAYTNLLKQGGEEGGGGGGKRRTIKTSRISFLLAASFVCQCRSWSFSVIV